MANNLTINSFDSLTRAFQQPGNVLDLSHELENPSDPNNSVVNKTLEYERLQSIQQQINNALKTIDQLIINRKVEINNPTNEKTDDRLKELQKNLELYTAYQSNCANQIDSLLNPANPQENAEVQSNTIQIGNIKYRVKIMIIKNGKAEPLFTNKLLNKELLSSVQSTVEKIQQSITENHFFLTCSLTLASKKIQIIQKNNTIVTENDQVNALQTSCNKLLFDYDSLTTHHLQYNRSLSKGNFANSGLPNLGNTCFANSALQLLLNTPGWIDDLQYTEDNANRNKLVRLLKTLHQATSANDADLADKIRYNIVHQTLEQLFHFISENAVGAISFNASGGARQSDPEEFLTIILDILEVNKLPLSRLKMAQGHDTELIRINEGNILQLSSITDQSNTLQSLCNQFFATEVYNGTVKFQDGQKVSRLQYSLEITDQNQIPEIMFLQTKRYIGKNLQIHILPEKNKQGEWKYKLRFETQQGKNGKVLKNIPEDLYLIFNNTTTNKKCAVRYSSKVTSYHDGGLDGGHWQAMGIGHANNQLTYTNFNDSSVSQSTITNTVETGTYLFSSKKEEIIMDAQKIAEIENAIKNSQFNDPIDNAKEIITDASVALIKELNDSLIILTQKNVTQEAVNTLVKSNNEKIAAFVKVQKAEVINPLDLSNATGSGCTIL